MAAAGLPYDRTYSLLRNSEQHLQLIPAASSGKDRLRGISTSYKAIMALEATRERTASHLHKIPQDRKLDYLELLRVGDELRIRFRMDELLIHAHLRECYIMTEDTFSFWNKDLVLEVRRRGFIRLTSYLENFPGMTYEQLGKELGGVPEKIVRLQFEEARAFDRLEQAAKDSLVRWLVQHLPRQVRSTEETQYGLASAFASWITGMVISGDCPEFKDVGRRMARQAMSSEVPVDWVPASVEDPVVAMWFEDSW